MDRRQIALKLVVDYVKVLPSWQIQNFIYIAQECGLHTSYKFCWLYGIHSADLEEDFEIIQHSTVDSSWAIDSRTKEILDKVRSLYSMLEGFEEKVHSFQTAAKALFMDRHLGDAEEDRYETIANQITQIIGNTVTRTDVDCLLREVYRITLKPLYVDKFNIDTKGDNMRKLASIQIVNAVEPIPDADAIEKVQILGWWVVAKKGEHKVGDFVVYCEIDALLPVRSEFEFLRASSYCPEVKDKDGKTIREEGFRIKTVKLRKQISQGICFPLSILGLENDPSASPDTRKQSRCCGYDVTESLGIKKWEPYLPLNAEIGIKGGMPGFLRKTDEPRIQSYPDVLPRHGFRSFNVTEKLDGTSYTAFIREGVFGICSRNYLLDPDCESVYARATRELNIKQKLSTICEQLGRDVAIQCELVGPGIQGNKYRLFELRLYVFNVILLDTGVFLNKEAVTGLLASVSLPSVPWRGKLNGLIDVDSFVKLSQQKSLLCPDIEQEGIVVRSCVETWDPDIGRLSFKVINPNFLLKFNE